MSTTNKQWYQGTNFWVSAVMVILGIFTGIQESDIRELVNVVFGGIGSVFAIREAIKGGSIDVKRWLSSANTYNYLFAIVATFLPTVPPEWFTQLNGIASGIVTQNYTAMLSGLAALGISIFYFVRNLKPKTPAVA